MKYIKNMDIDIIPTEEGEAVLFDSESGSTHVLDSVAVDIIQILEEGKTIDELVSELAKLYSADTDEIKADVEEFLKDLVEKKIVFVS
jgi:PqqD family protein of HPr-rel-A system